MGAQASSRGILTGLQHCSDLDPFRLYPQSHKSIFGKTLFLGRETDERQSLDPTL